MSSFFWFQKTGGVAVWQEALSEHREKVIAETKPAFVTVLDSFTSPDDTWGREEFSKMKYSGPLYFDWDSDDITLTIPPFLEFLAKLEENGLNLESIRLFATGGRGFHCEIPEAIFNSKPAKGGTTLLPYIYKEMALELAVDTLDLRVYTGRKGRMWRVPGVQRDNGKYKVAITLDQALSMTAELYAELTATPCDSVPIEEPVINVYLASMFAKAANKVDAALRIRNKSKLDDELLAKFKGEFPPTVLRVMSGEGVMQSVGFQRIAMQLAITANALGKSWEDLVKLSEGLVQSHEGDSQRYNSPRKRKEELRRMWEYTHDNPVYGFSRGGIKSLCIPGTPTSDLDGLSESAGVGHVPNDDVDEAALPTEMQAEVDSASSSLLEGVMILNGGIYKRTADGAKMISNLSFRKPAKMIDTEDNLLIGLEAELVSDGVNLGRQLIDLPTFASRANLSKFCSGRSAIFSGTDTQAGVVQLNLSRAAIKGGRVIYIVRKEGLDIVQNPTVRDKVQRDIVWASADGVLCNNTDVKYSFQPKVSKSAVFKTDIHLAEPIENTDEAREWMHAVLDINSPVIVAQMLGWFVSCFHRQFYHAGYSQFPLLHPNGPAGSGKTLTTMLFARLFHVTTPPVMYGCSATASTPFTLKSAWTGSASIPVILDEYKPSELGITRTDFLLQHFRLLYNQGSGASGGINRGGADTSFRDITNYTYSAPTAFLGESQEMQTAVVQRSLPVSFTPAETVKHTNSYNQAAKGADMMPRLGALLLRLSLSETTESRVTALDPIRNALRSQFDRSVHDRQVFNLSVVLAGLDFLDNALSRVFGEEFRAEIELLRSAVYDHKADINVSAMSEACKVLNDMSLISRTEEPGNEWSLREGYEYIVGENRIEILMREAFVKYFAWAKRKGFSPLYISSDSFISAMAKTPALVDKMCFDSKLRNGNGQSKIFSFDLEKLQAEGVEPFKSKFLP
jgi:hypothetical protein